MLGWKSMWKSDFEFSKGHGVWITRTTLVSELKRFFDSGSEKAFWFWFFRFVAIKNFQDGDKQNFLHQIIEWHSEEWVLTNKSSTNEKSIKDLEIPIYSCNFYRYNAKSHDGWILHR